MIGDLNAVAVQHSLKITDRHYCLNDNISIQLLVRLQCFQTSCTVALRESTAANSNRFH